MGCVDNRANSFLALSQRVFGPLAVGDVARHFRKATEASRLVTQGRDDHIGPEPRPIFAHSPALVFQQTLARCHAQLLLGLAPLSVFSRIKAGEMLADDLIWAITLNLFCPPVPTDDMPQGIQHENRVVLYALHQQRSEEHTSELQSPCNLVCRLLLEKKKQQKSHTSTHSNKRI